MIKRLLLITLIASTARAMVFDNRFLPLFLKPFTRRDDALSHLRFQSFFMHADEAFSDGFRLEIPDICCTYDQRVLAQAITDVGFPDPLRSDFRLRTSIPWNRLGRLDAQGLAFLYEQEVFPWLSFGINGLFAHVSSRHQFLLTGSELQLPPGDKDYLFQVKEKMHKDLGICPPVFSKTGFGDLDLYMRFNYRCDYTLKFRRIDASLKFGIYVPSASERDINNPASIALGGNKHFGLYAGIQNELELREDLYVGWMFRAIKRLEKTRCIRMPLLNEPPEYGTLVGPARIDPGWTFVFNPYFSLAHLRQGFGVKGLYTLVSHLKDRIFDARPGDKQRALPSRLGVLENCSSWASEYVSIGAYYDFGKVHDCPSLYPKISVYWDIPVNWIVSKRAAKTNSVSLMVELDF